jgi:hypothetical protein
MDTATKILIIGGLICLNYAAINGWFITAIRFKSATYPEALRQAHIGTIMQGSMLLGLVFAVALSDLSDGIETLAAILLVAGAFLIAAKNTYNWRMGIKDDFAEPVPISKVLGGGSVIATTIGLAILLIGAILGL